MSTPYIVVAHYRTARTGYTRIVARNGFERPEDGTIVFPRPGLMQFDPFDEVVRRSMLELGESRFVQVDSMPGQMEFIPVDAIEHLYFQVEEVSE